jgi:hypothetical protein
MIEMAKQSGAEPDAQVDPMGQTARGAETFKSTDYDEMLVRAEKNEAIAW